MPTARTLVTGLLGLTMASCAAMTALYAMSIVARAF